MALSADYPVYGYESLWCEPAPAGVTVIRLLQSAPLEALLVPRNWTAFSAQISQLGIQDQGIAYALPCTSQAMAWARQLLAKERRLVDLLLGAYGKGQLSRIGQLYRQACGGELGSWEDYGRISHRQRLRMLCSLAQRQRDPAQSQDEALHQLLCNTPGSIFCSDETVQRMLARLERVELDRPPLGARDDGVLYLAPPQPGKGWGSVDVTWPDGSGRVVVMRAVGGQQIHVLALDDHGQALERRPHELPDYAALADWLEDHLGSQARWLRNPPNSSASAINCLTVAEDGREICIRTGELSGWECGVRCFYAGADGALRLAYEPRRRAEQLGLDPELAEEELVFAIATRIRQALPAERLLGERAAFLRPLRQPSPASSTQDMRAGGRMGGREARLEALESLICHRLPSGLCHPRLDGQPHRLLGGLRAQEAYRPRSPFTG